MKKNIIADSCCDGNKDIEYIARVPLTIRIGEKTFVDDENIDIKDLLKTMKESKEVPATSCPSPNDYMERIKKNESNFIVTLSSELSGSYNSAILAKELYQEEDENTFIHVFDSRNAAVGETMICIKLSELINQGLSDKEIVKQTSEYIENMHIFFVLESLDNLIKNGRIGLLKGKIASFFSIIPIMMGTTVGKIDLKETVRGVKKTYDRLVEIIGEQVSEMESKTLGISHCNSLEKALELKKKIQEKYRFKEVVVLETGGISTVYANDGGIIISF